MINKGNGQILVENLEDYRDFLFHSLMMILFKLLFETFTFEDRKSKCRSQEICQTWLAETFLICL